MNKGGVIHYWFAQPLDDWTNEVLSKNQRFLSEEAMSERSRGIPYNMWACERYEFVRELINNRVRMNLRFKVWHKFGNGVLSRWKLNQGRKAWTEE